jgi:hypothetical protein
MTAARGRRRAALPPLEDFRQRFVRLYPYIVRFLADLVPLLYAGAVSDASHTLGVPTTEGAEAARRGRPFIDVM